MRVVPRARSYDDACGGDSAQARRYREALLSQLEGEVRSPRVLEAMWRVPRHLFVPGASLRRAYANHAMAIGYGQTISQPSVVALMAEALELTGSERVLEIGTGSGYQAAVLSLLAAEVFTTELEAHLAESARVRLGRLGYGNVHVRTGDGHAGWPEAAPFERIVVTAAPEEVPRALVDQLDEGGILVTPVGATPWTQRLLRYQRRGELITREDLGAVRFVPMLGGDEH